MNKNTLDLVAIAQIVHRVKEGRLSARAAVWIAVSLLGATKDESAQAVTELERRLTAKPITLGELRDHMLPSTRK